MMKIDRALRWVLFALLGVLALAGCAAPQPVDDGKIIEYRSEKFGFRVSHPAQWQVLEDPQPLVGDNPIDLHAVAFLPGQETKTLIAVWIQTLTTTQTLDEYVGQQMTSMQNNEVNAQFSDPTPTHLGGLNALATRATVTATNPATLERVILVINGRQGYGMTFYGPPEGDTVQAFEALMQSFAFLP